MSEILLLADKVRNTLMLGESHFREFKSALERRRDENGNITTQKRSVKDICNQIAQGLVSFANADGGAILVGVEDDGTIS
jgi:ATP-dependent DNA helicase RecG